VTSNQLDRRREQTAAAHTAVERTRTTVTELDNRLRTNADLTTQQKQALRNAEAEARRLKRALKTQARDKDRLEKAHRKAVARAGKAESKAAALEKKYGKSLLDDLIRREKERDRASATTPASSPLPEAPVSPALPAVVPPSPVETITVSDTARATAARRTAAKAASSATGTTTRARTPRKTATAVETPAPARRSAPRKQAQ
jgi:hypothetical protein